MRNLVILSVLVVMSISGSAPAAKGDESQLSTYFRTYKAEGQLYSLHSFSADVAVTWTDPSGSTRMSGSVECLKPRYVLFNSWYGTAGAPAPDRAAASPHYSVLSDGKAIWKIDPYQGTTSGPMQIADLADEWYLFSGFFQPNNSIVGQMIDLASGYSASPTTWSGAHYQKVDITEVDGHFALFIGSDGLVHRLVNVDGTDRFEVVLSHVKVNPQLTPADFISQTPKSKIDPVAKAILQNVEGTYRGLHSLTASAVEVTHSNFSTQKRTVDSEFDAEVKLLRPNFMFYDSNFKESPRIPGKIVAIHEMTEVSDGSNLWRMWDFKKNQYEKRDPGAEGSHIIFFGASNLLSTFFGSGRRLSNADTEPEIKSVTYAGTARWHGDLYRLIRTRLAESRILTSFIGADNLVHRTVSHNVYGDSTFDRDNYLTDLQINPTLTASDFSWVPPKGATEKEQFPDIADTPSQKLLTNGTTAPDFTVHDRLGHAVSLADFRGKVVVLDFWATWCGPCQVLLPSTNGVGRRYRDKDVVILGVNVWDTPEAFQAWLPTHKSYDAIKFAIDPTGGQKDVASLLYQVSGIPTQYVLDRAGKIVWSTDGYSGSDNELVKAIDTALAVR